MSIVVRGEQIEFAKKAGANNEEIKAAIQIFGPGSAFLGVANTWHKSSI